MAVILAAPVSLAQRENLAASPNQLYLVISNGVTEFFLTAYNTIPDYSYRIQTNTDVSNPGGWGTWMTVVATNAVTPLASISTAYTQMYFRAIVLGEGVGTGPATHSPPTVYLGRVENEANWAALRGSAVQADSNLKGWAALLTRMATANASQPPMR